MLTPKKICIILAAAVYGLFLSVSPSFAVVIRNGDNVTIPKNETINESVYLGGQVINVDGTVEGDLFCGGQDIEITGVVNGDVICGGQSITISGQVTGDVRVGGQTIRVNGSVDRNANLFGQNVTISSGSAILGEAIIGSQNADIDGSIAKKLTGGAQSITINGTVGEVDVYVETLAIGSSAVIQKNLTYTSDTTAEIGRKESVQGKIVKKTPPADTKRDEGREKAWNAFWGSARIASLISQILLAFVIVYFLPKRIKSAALLMQDRALPAFGWGALMLFLFPIVMILFVITIIGIPLAMVLLFLFIFSFFVSRVLAAMVVGRMLLQQFWAAKKENNYWTVAIGFAVLWLIYSTPFIGGLVSFLSLLWGLGGVYYLLRPATAAPASTVKKPAKK